MLSYIFLGVINVSLLVTPFIILFLLFRQLVKGFIPRSIMFIAWALIFLRLIMPFSISSQFSFYNYIDSFEVTQIGNISSVTVVEDSKEKVNFPVLNHDWSKNPGIDETLPVNDITASEKQSLITQEPISYTKIFSVLWISGFLALILFAVFCYYMVLGKLKKERIDITTDTIKTVKKTLSWDESIAISQADSFSTPILSGLYNCTVTLPMSMDIENFKTVQSVLTHEQIHLKRCDNLWRLLAAIILYIHWFNPLVWLCYALFIKDMEVSCDELVLKHQETDIRQEYAQSLLNLAAGDNALLYGGILCFGESSIKERVKCIMNYRKVKMSVIIMCFTVIIAFAVVFLTNPVETVAQPAEVEQSSEPSETVKESASEPIEPQPQQEPAEPESPPQEVAPPEASTPPQTVYLPTEISSIYYDGKEIEQAFTLNLENSTYHKIASVDAINKIIAELGGIEEKSPGNGDSGVLLNFKDGSRESIAFYKEDYPNLATLCESNNEKTIGNIQWIAFMNTDKITNIRFNTYDDAIGLNTSDKDAITEVSNYLKSIEVTGEIHILDTPANPAGGRGANTLYITFSTDGEYYIRFYTNGINIYSNHLADKYIHYDLPTDSMTELDEIFKRISQNFAKEETLVTTSAKRISLYNNHEKTFVTLDSKIYAQMQELKPLSKDELGDPLVGFNRIEAVDVLNKKFIYDLYQNGFTVQGTGIEGMVVAQSYTLPDWDGFKNSVTQSIKGQEIKAYWLGLMIDDKIESVTIESQTESKNLSDESLRELVGSLGDIKVKSPVTMIVNPTDNTPIAPQGDEYVTILVDFNNDITYTVFLTEYHLTIHSSDMSYSLLYELKYDMASLIYYAPDRW